VGPVGPVCPWARTGERGSHHWGFEDPAAADGTEEERQAGGEEAPPRATG